MPKKQRISHLDHKLIASAHFRRERGTYFSLLYGRLSGDLRDFPRVACVVSKKTATRAAERNLIKRRCREAARETLINVKYPAVFVFYAARSAKSATFSEIKTDVQKLINKTAEKIPSALITG